MVYKKLDDLLDNKVVEIYAEYTNVDNGIGRYECHGFIGFDSHPDILVDNIAWNITLYTAEENTIIDNYISNNYHELVQWFHDNHKSEDDEPDCEPLEDR